MALVRGRRQINLRLPLPEPSERRPRFPLPLPPDTASSAAATWPPATSSSSSSSSSSSISLQDLERLHVLGHGNGGTVYKVRHRKTGAVYALKLVQAPDTDPALRRRAARERDILLRAADSPHVVRCHAVFDHHAADAAILMEYMAGGTLEAVLRSSGTFPEPRLASVARQVLSGLSHLHARKIIHRDIKPSNLLVDDEMSVVKIADFGVSKMMCRVLDACNSYVGTCAYMSPERFDPEAHGGTYDGYAADVWSFGLTLMELYLGHFPLLPAGQRPDWATLMCAICFGDAPAAPEGVSDEFCSFLECCLQKDAAKRWSASQLLTHPFLSKDQELS